MQKKAKLYLKKIAKNRIVPLLYLAIFCFISCKKESHPKVLTISEALQITKINDNGYLHVSYITLESGSTFPCNGFIYIKNNEAYIFDSPATDQATTELIHWLQNDQKVAIKGVVYNHFHRDCTKGAAIFEKHNIPSIASSKTATLIREKKYIKPKLVFEDTLTLTLGSTSIHNTFFGEAHTIDNIISYFPEERIMYGGCMIKSLNAAKGNLDDANVAQWSNTVSKIKKAHPDVTIVIPGHGKYGNVELLNYTISLFKTEE